MAAPTATIPIIVVSDTDAPSWKFTYPGGVGYTGSPTYMHFMMRTIMSRVREGSWRVENSALKKEECAAFDGGVEPWFSATQVDDLAEFIAARNAVGGVTVNVSWVRDDGSNWVTTGLKDAFMALWHAGELSVEFTDLVIAEGRAGGIIQKNG